MAHAAELPMEKVELSRVTKKAAGSALGHVGLGEASS